MDCVENHEDELMMPGFRFHPTDEELVSFYLNRKIQQKPPSIELIKQLDIYKYDPWDLPNFATSGEKEWYFYCPRDRKYRNSARPNRVTGAGFWKATGTDRPIYSSEGTKCIGLKKSLVFYKGRAGKGTKTDWMMHEFRLPSVSDSSMPKRPLEKTIPINEAWAICKIFKKSTTVAHRGISQSWGSQFQEINITESDMFPVSETVYANEALVSDTISCSTNTMSTEPSSSLSQFNFPAFEFDLPNITFPQEDVPQDSMLLNFSQSPRSNELREDLPLGYKYSDGMRSSTNRVIVNGTQAISFPFNLSPVTPDDRRPNTLWDSNAFPNEISTGFSNNL